jgi:hypothetical protein
MRRSPSIAPASPDDFDVYLVLNDYGECLGRAWAEVPEADTGRETVIRDLMTGQYSGPVRIVAFNTAELWSRDVSEEMLTRCHDASHCDTKPRPLWWKISLQATVISGPSNYRCR